MNRGALPDPELDFPSWYGEVIKRAGMAEHGPAKGSMIIKPYGYAIWERMQRYLDDMFKATGHANFYFPLLFPEALLDRESEHVEGFTPQVAVVTRGGGAELEEPLVIRPTSEAVIWPTYAKWIQSYRDLPLLYNQWCNVLRWEKRSRLFLRTSEFLWQEGHTAHASRGEALDEAKRMLELYRAFAQDVLAIPVITGRKSESERFPGADDTYSVEGLMRDRKALQCATSHFLGQNFARAYGVRFLNSNDEEEFAWGTSWGLSTRMIGGTVMAHGDNRGLRLPPQIAPIQVVIVPIYQSDEDRIAVTTVASRARDELAARGTRVELDDRPQHRPGFKFADWELKGIPLRVEIGPDDVVADSVTIVPRTSTERSRVSMLSLIMDTDARLQMIQKHLYQDALDFRSAHTHHADSLEELRDGIREQMGLWLVSWCGRTECEERVALDTQATIRCLPLVSDADLGACGICGQKAEHQAIWARAY